MNNPAILSLSSVVPNANLPQMKILERMIEIFDLSEEQKNSFQRLYEQSGINKRHSVLSEFLTPKDTWEFWGKDYPKTVPGTAKRNKVYKEEAPKLALNAAQIAISNWKGSPTDITHIIAISCTGLMAPGIEFILQKELGLKDDIYRYGINFMGCFGAFKGLSLANTIAKESNQHRILIVCVELCSLHFQAELTQDYILGNSLFADGAAAAIVGIPKTHEEPLYTIIRTNSLSLSNSENKMTWEISDQGFSMKLSSFVPGLISRNIKEFCKRILGPITSVQESFWAIHPGGKSIIQAVERGLDLVKDQTNSSWNILRDFGNMSSSSFLFVLEHNKKNDHSYPYTAGVGFGPGLSMEGILLQNV